jgi:hypothetical protein
MEELGTMARRGMWLIGGVAVGVGALVLKPDSRTWLRRRLGMEAEDRRWFEEDDAPAEHEGDEPLDTREARYSLRARLAEEAHAEPAAPAEEAHAEPAAPAEPLSPTPTLRSPLAAAPPPPPLPAVEDEPPAEVAPAAATPRVAAVPDPAPEPEPAPPPARESAPAFESVPPIGSQEDMPKTPGEDTSEIEAVPAADAGQEPQPPPPAPIPLRPPTAPPARPPSRPFSESTSFRSAIDAARERVHGAAREATPDDGESTEPLDERDN